MIEKISLCVADESGALIDLAESDLKLQSRLDTLIADTFSEIVRRQQDIADDEIRNAEKFHFAFNLNRYLQEMKENDGRPNANA